MTRRPGGSIPDRFHAFVVDRADGGVQSRIQLLSEADLPEGEVVVRVDWSSVNYKDGLACKADGKVAKMYPLVPGIDLAGVVVRSRDRRFEPGEEVLAHGYDLGVARHGGYSAYQRVPARWLVHIPDGLTPRDCMAIGTAGFTAGMAVALLESQRLRPERGPVLVTGASGGVGRLALAILAARGYEVWAATGKLDQEAALRALGAVGVLPRDEVVAASPRPLATGRWAAVVDSVGQATLPYALRTVQYGGLVAACGNASGALLSTSVLPFILRAVRLIGVDSVAVPIRQRTRLWRRMATDLRPPRLNEMVSEVRLGDLAAALDLILAGEARGRWLVRVQ